jgi:hypothetical protein
MAIGRECGIHPISIIRNSSSTELFLLFSIARRTRLHFRRRTQSLLLPKREQFPEPKGGSGTHYVSILSRCAARKAGKIEAASEVPHGASGHCDSRRVRDKERLRYLSSPQCVVCGRLPSQVHHFKHAQPRAVGLKVGDQWTVPLCNLHRGARHDAGAEGDWWLGQKVDPIAVVLGLWRPNREQLNAM